jgi:hypothetical protein
MDGDRRPRRPGQARPVVRPSEPITWPTRRAPARYETGTRPSEPSDPRPTPDSGKPGHKQANPANPSHVQPPAHPPEDPYKQEVARSSQAPPMAETDRHERDRGTSRAKRPTDCLARPSRRVATAGPSPGGPQARVHGAPVRPCRRCLLVTAPSLTVKQQLCELLDARKRDALPLLHSQRVVRRLEFDERSQSDRLRLDARLQVERRRLVGR